MGICLGMQLLFSESEEASGSAGLGVISGRVPRFDAAAHPELKIPHMGWNTVEVPAGSRLFAGVEDERFYFVHSYGCRRWELVTNGRTEPPRVIWAEHEPLDPADVDPEDDALGYHLDLLEDRLMRHGRDPAFGLEPLDEHVASMCRSLGLDPDLARRWRELPEPGFGVPAGAPAPEPRDSG